MPRLPESFEKGERIGTGRHKEVYLNSKNNSEVIKEFKPELSITVLKGYFYLTKIVHILFPNFIPDIHFVGKDKKDIAVEDLVPHDVRHLQLMGSIVGRHELISKLNRQNLKDDQLVELSGSWSEFRGKMVDGLGLYIDFSAINFIRDSKGQFKYVEGFFPWVKQSGRLERDYDLSLLFEAISKLPEPDHTRAQNYLNRLEALFTQAQKEAESNKSGN